MSYSLGGNPAPEGFNHAMKSLFGAVSTFVLLVIVCLISMFEARVFGQTQLAPIGLQYFLAGGVFIIGWFILLSDADRICGLFALLARTIRPSPPGVQLDLFKAEHASPGRFRRVITNHWIPVTFQFCLVGWLMYASGGLVSPYTPVIVGMMMIGQSIYPTPSIGPGGGMTVRQLLLSFWRVGCYYGYPQLLFGSVLVAVALLQEYHPLVTTLPPFAEMIFTSQLSLFISMCVVFVTRSADGAGTSRRR
jgi:hypothetical protein